MVAALEITVTERSLKPGYKTTEFWLSLLCAAIGTALIYQDQPQLGAMLLGLAGLSYNGSRVARK